MRHVGQYRPNRADCIGADTGIVGEGYTARLLLFLLIMREYKRMYIQCNHTSAAAVTFSPHLHFFIRNGNRVGRLKWQEKPTVKPFKTDSDSSNLS